MRRQLALTIDLDGLDPSWMPGVGTPEPGGLGWYEMDDLMAAVAVRHRVVGLDLVELLPGRDQGGSAFQIGRAHV